MRRVLVLTWALGTATGVLLGLFGVQLVSSRFSTAGVSPMSRPEVLRALQAARSGPVAADQVAAAPVTPSPDTALPPAPPPVDAAPPPPPAGPTSSPAPAPPPSTVPRPGPTGGSFVQAAAAPSPPTSTTIVAASETLLPSTTATTEKELGKKKGGSRNSTTSTTKKSTTTTSPRKTTATTTEQPRPSGSAHPADTRTISSAGGVVGVRFSNGKVELKWARPNPGYQVYVEDNGPDSVVVYFYTKSKLSRVRAYYNGGSPVTDVWEYSGRDPRGQM